MRPAAALVAALALGLALAAPRGATARSEGPAVERLVIDVLSTVAHDRTAYTQGLLLDGGALYESTGRTGYSTLREVDPASGAVRRSVALPPSVFAEGLALVDDRLIQLTWQSEVAYVWDRATFAPRGTLAYSGEGWGLCHDGTRLVMSDGSDRLTFRDPTTFAPVGHVAVRLDGRPVDRLNELECVEGLVYANVWTETDILRIDPATGDVTAVIDGSAVDADLRRRHDLSDRYDCLNGIAHIPGTDRFYVTGKNWPEMYEARFVPPATPGPTSASSATPSATATPQPTAPPPAPAYLPFAQRAR